MAVVVGVAACVGGASARREAGFGDGEAGVVRDTLGEMRFFNHALDKSGVCGFEVLLDKFGHKDVAAEVGVFS